MIAQKGIQVKAAEDGVSLTGLLPSSQYVLKPWSDKWACETAVTLDSAPQGETAMLPSPMVIARAFSKRTGGLVIDLASGKTRFETSSEGVIADSQTGLEWVVGPDRDTNYDHAEQWVATCNVAGGGWRMPTRVELKTLYQQGVSERNMDPSFKTTGWWVWAEPKDSSSAGDLSFSFGSEPWSFRGASYRDRVFAVRSR